MVRFDGSRIYPERVSDTLGCAMTLEEQNLCELTTDYIRSYYNRARILNRSAAKLAMSVFQRRLTSSTWALICSFDRRVKKLDQLIQDIQTGKLSEAELEARQRKLASTLPDPLDSKPADEEEGEENEQIEDRALGGVVTVSLSELVAERQQVATLKLMAEQFYDRADDCKFERLREVIRDPRFKEENERYGTGGDVARELPKMKEQLEAEERRRLMPGYVRRFVEKTLPLLDLRADGDLDEGFELRAARPRRARAYYTRFRTGYRIASYPNVSTSWLALAGRVQPRMKPTKQMFRGKRAPMVEKGPAARSS